MTIGAGGLLLPTGILLTVLSLAVIRRVFTARRLRQGSEISGLYVAAIAAIYGVLLGFMVLAVWTRFDQAEARTEEEAATLGTVARLAHALPPGKGGDEVIRACRDYAMHIQTDEWPTMTQGRESAVTHRALDHLWSTVLRLQVISRQESPMVSESISQMTELSRLRRLRLLACRSGFPPLLWAVLIAGAGLTMGTTLLWWTESFRMHVLLASCLWLMISLSLLATAELSTPFQGDVHIDHDVFAKVVSEVDFPDDTTLDRN